MLSPGFSPYCPLGRISPTAIPLRTLKVPLTARAQQTPGSSQCLRHPGAAADDLQEGRSIFGAAPGGPRDGWNQPTAHFQHQTSSAADA